MTKQLLKFTGYCLFINALLNAPSWAQVIAPSAQEVKFSYEATFVAKGEVNARGKVVDPETLASDHAQHMLGLFHSPTLIEKFQIDPNQVGGIGAPKMPFKISIVSATKSDQDGKVLIKYRNSGLMLLHNNAAKALLQSGTFEVPLPYDVTKIYNIKCTDSHYTSEGDYWYFYDPYRDGCQYLLESPYAQLTKINIQPSTKRKIDQSPRLDLLRGDNGNGSLFSIYAIDGFAESSTSRSDEGRENFKDLNQYLTEQGFKLDIENRRNTQPLYRFTKSLVLANGKKIDVEVKHLLVETGIDSRSVTFAKFFKEAVENADVIIYGGHSGLGGNLDIPSLEEKAGGFKFNPKKKQIFYFESCSSYTYYLDEFRVEKTRSSIDVISNGLSSAFNVWPDIFRSLMDTLMDTKRNDRPWLDILRDMEAPLEGGSYLLNVGGV